MADNKKIITDELLKLQTEKILQVVADSVYDLVPFDEQEIDDMFDATPQEISYYESLINPDVVSENRLWSSKTIDEKLASAILEANKYTDEAATRNLTTEIVSSTTDVTKENVLYLILSDAGTNTYEQYMLIGGTATALGSTQVDLSNVYNKSEIDSKLDVKANKSEVLSTDSVQTIVGSETNDTVYSSKLTKDELDKKANDDEVVKKTDITTTIDSSTTDDVVVGGKLLYNELLKLSNDNFIEDANNPTSFICKTDRDTLNTPYKEGLTSAAISLIISVARGADQWNGQISISMASTDFFIRDKGGLGWNPWVKLMTKTDIATTIDSASTDTKVPSAKAVETRVNKVNKCTIYSNEDLNLIIEPGLYACVGGDVYGATHNFPVPDNGYLQHIAYPADGYCMQTFVPNGVWGEELNMYVRRLRGGVWSSWKRLCGTTSVADVGITNITSFSSNYTSGTVSYMIKNGMCHVSVIGLKLTSTGYNVPICGGMPTPALGFVDVLAEDGGNLAGNIMISGDGKLTSHYHDATKNLHCTFSYPVAE